MREFRGKKVLRRSNYFSKKRKRKEKTINNSGMIANTPKNRQQKIFFTKEIFVKQYP